MVKANELITYSVLANDCGYEAAAGHVKQRVTKQGCSDYLSSDAGSDAVYIAGEYPCTVTLT